MSTAPENELDLEKLFLPAWAQEAPTVNKYEKYEGGEDRFPERHGDRRGPRREGPRPGGPRREGGFREGRPAGPGRGEARPPGGPREGRGGGRPGFRGDRRPQRPERREPPPPLPEVNLSLIPEERGVESLARQIKMTGRAYPLFDIAQMILQKPDRVMAQFSVKKNSEGQPIQPLWVCALDETLWLAEDEAVAHVLARHFSTFYQAEKTATEPPKGKYTFVAQCGLSGAILGPPNYHDYQTQLRKLHAERFSRMPFEVYKSRVRIVRDEEVVKKWVEDQSWKTEYLCLNLPEPLRLDNLEAVEKHFRETHKDNIIKRVESHTLPGARAREIRSPELARLARAVWEDQRRFPLQIATVLSQQFASHGLQFFKVNKTITHVAVARPHYLDLEATPVSEGVRRIVNYIDAHPKCSRRQLIESLAPAPIPVTPPAPAAEGEAAAAPAPAVAQHTLEQSALNSDLHWLIHQGHVIEFANGALETAKKPLPKPPKPEKPKPTAETAAAPAPAAEPAPAEAPAPAPESAPALEAFAGDAAASVAAAPPVESTAPPEPAPGEPPASGQTLENPPADAP